jgi:glycosyltransferase involved in cell wall biosynthesis
MVLLEPMAAGIPVISSNCGGAPEVLGDAGRLFPVANSEALAQALLGIYGMGQEERRSMVEALQERLKGNFTDEAVRGAFWKQSFAGELC